MNPTALKIGPLTIQWYGVMVATAFASGLYLIYLRVRNTEDLDFEQASDLSVYGLMGAIIGARLFYVLSNLSVYLEDPLQIIRIDKAQTPIHLVMSKSLLKQVMKKKNRVRSDWY